VGSDWLQDAVLYEVYPQSFADSNGDGIGDLRGVIERLDYIASLGVDTLWFNPVLRFTVRRCRLRRLGLPEDRAAVRQQ
jgi:1,4-alpha-glucan branching enzyme